MPSSLEIVACPPLSSPKLDLHLFGPEAFGARASSPSSLCGGNSLVGGPTLAVPLNTSGCDFASARLFKLMGGVIRVPDMLL